MAQHRAEVLWERGNQDFLDNKYSRRHMLRFDGGAEVAASSSPHVVPVPFSDASVVDPEEMFIASIASCHMLWFLSIAAGRRFRIDRYVDSATGAMRKNASGKLFVASVTLRPRVEFSGERMPARPEVEAMHHQAHEECFIANSVKTEVLCEPAYV